MPSRRYLQQPNALADLGAGELEAFRNHREQFIQDHPELADLLRRAGNEYLAIGWRMLFDANGHSYSPFATSTGRARRSPTPHSA